MKIIVGLILLGLVASAVAAAQAPVFPARRAASPQASPIVPSLPPGWAEAASLTLEIDIRSQGAAGTIVAKQTFSRSAGRINVRLDNQREWLFEQNAVDPRRVAAFLIDHDDKVIVEHSGSDLRNRQQVRGWSDVFSLGFDAALLEGLKRGNAWRTLGGLRFERYTAVRSTAGTVRDVWWNAEQCLPLQFETRSLAGDVLVVVRSLRREVDASKLLPPQVRFPSYALVDAVDWADRRKE